MKSYWVLPLTERGFLTDKQLAQYAPGEVLPPRNIQGISVRSRTCALAVRVAVLEDFPDGTVEIYEMPDDNAEAISPEVDFEPGEDGILVYHPGFGLRS